MKKLKTLTVVAVCSALLFGCACGSSKSADATDKAVSVAQQAIDTIDSYLDGKTDGSAASSKLDDLYSQMDYVNDMPQDTSDEIQQYTADWDIRANIGLSSSSITFDKYEGDNETFDKIIEYRNTIAEDAGLEKR